MADVALRKRQVILEEIFHDGGPAPAKPIRRAACISVIANPFAGRYVQDVQPFMAALEPLGLAMSEALVAALGGDPTVVEGYGKGSIIGAAGELEHGALWHVPGGYAMRRLLGEARAIVPSATKMGGLGARLDVPLGHINAAYVRSHFDAMEIGLPDGPRADEIAFILVMATGGRIHARMGGLTVAQIAGTDGLR